MSIYSLPIILVSLSLPLLAQLHVTTHPSASSDKQKLGIRVAPDGFPSGHETPEGIAVDLARAFISKDSKLFRRVCIPPFGGGENRKTYEEFLSGVEASIIAESTKAEPSLGGPKKINLLYAARHLSKNEPSSYGYAVFDFMDVMFVDVVVTLQNGSRINNRTLVIKANDGKWYVHPAPHTCQLLCVGLNEETASTALFTDVYRIQKE